MKFVATKKQIQEIAVHAINASKPVGMGMLHYKSDTVFRPQDIDFEGNFLYLDYVQGRLVTLNLKQVSPNIWECSSKPHPGYQSWAATYPTYQCLILSVEGTSILDEGGST